MHLEYRAEDLLPLATFMIDHGAPLRLFRVGWTLVGVGCREYGGEGLI